MKVLNLIQGSAEWKSHRATARNASEVAAVLNCSPYMTRNQLLHIMHTGIRPEPSPEEQRRFDRGHAIEAIKRKVAESIMGEDLFPCVGTAVLSDKPLSSTDGIELSGSFDGLKMLEDENWECKSLNDELRAALPNPGPDGNDAARLPKFYRVQMQQQCMVSGCKRVLFTASDGADDDRHCWFYPDAKLAREIMAGWRQFDADLAAYVLPEVVERVTAAPIETLPAVSVQMQGALAVISNLDVFGAKLREFVTRIPPKPSTEQEFADCAAAVKALEKAEEALDAAEANALGQVQSVEELTRTIATLREVSATARKATNRMVEDRKKQIRLEQVQRGREALAAHIASLNAQIGKNYMPAIAADFGAAISGKKTVDSLRNAIDTELSRAKIAANEIAGTINLNLNWLREHAAGHTFLFADTAAIVLKAPDDLQALATNRIHAHKAAEEKRLEAEREKIRKEEEAKAERVQVNLNNLKAYRPSDTESSSWHRERIQALKAEPMTEAIYGGRLEEAKRIQAQLVDDLVDACQAASDSEAAARQSAPAAIPTLPPAAAPIAQPALSSQAPNVVPMVARVQDTGARLRLGEINARLSPIALTAEGLATLGFQPVAIEKAAKLYRESDFPRICGALIGHLQRVSLPQQAA